ncbi:SDR family oxidoreductase [Geopsychrobacter electrodiphilus]|uniref:SDR family oxidoreductase n=1 Tax=Geopsychrobacter electrodiphilus TaxID=225196 RepID=UPI000362E4B2|nr:NAD(P)-dependent oxidoreductase [Geopsychrobacter electrodiphilus]
MKLTNKTIFITGGSRGIGLEIALAAAREGANIVIAARSNKPQPKLPGTIHTAAKAIESAGGKCLPLVMDVRDETRVAECATEAAAHFGGIDILVNNASAIYLAGSLDVPAKRFDLMQQVNMRGTFMASQACLPYLLKSENPHILTLSPPINLDPKWFIRHTAYTISKYSMSMCVFGLAAEFGPQGVGVNALWPKTVIDTAALAMLKGMVDPKNCRLPKIVADAAVAIFKRDAKRCSGNFFIDEEVLREEGVSDFSGYAVRAGEFLMPDLFLSEVR